MVAGALLLLPGCGDADTPATEPRPTTPIERAPLPPSSFDELREIFAPRFEAVGMRLTRASLVELDGGPHLQLYIEPPGELSTEDYVDNIVPTTAAVAPFVFEAFADLASFDLCQEPPPGVDDSVAPEQVTVVALTRQQAAQLEWPDPELSELIAAVAGESFGEVRGNAAVEASAAFREAVAAGG